MRSEHGKQYLSNPLSTLLTKLSWVAKVLNKVWQQTQDIQREACTETHFILSEKHIQIPLLW